MIRVSDRAVGQYRQLVRNCTEAEAEAALSKAVFECAQKIGCSCVRLPGGQRAILRDGEVRTVLSAKQYRRQIRRVGLGRYGHGHKFEQGE